MFAVTALLCLVARALAQTTTSADTTTATSPASSSTVSLWLPMGGIPDMNIQASILFARSNATAYVLGCTEGATRRYCDRNPPLTVTEGESTVQYTNTFFRNEGTVKSVEQPLTIQCELVGANLAISRGASSAVCSVSSELSGLGIKVSTTILASTEINYMPVTITDGMEKLRTLGATATSGEPGASTGAAVAHPEITAIARLGLGGALGMLVLANV